MEAPSPLDPPPPEETVERDRGARAPWFVLLGSALLYFLRFGYTYGYSDQDEILPYLLHRMDPGLFTQDWFVQLQVNEFSVRTYFVWLLNLFTIFIPVWAAVLLIHTVTWMLLAAAVYALAHHFTRDRLAAAGAVLGALVLTPQWTLGGNDLVHAMLVPSTVAWMVGLWAVYLYFHKRYLLVPVLLGVATWMQALVGLQLAGVVMVVRFLRIFTGDRTHTFGGLVVFVLLFLLWASPSLGPLVYQQLFVEQAALPETPSLFYIMAAFRLPHHYLAGSFPVGAYLRFGLLLALGLAALGLPAYRRRLQEVDFLVATLGVIAVACLVAAVAGEVFASLFVTKLQLFKLTVFAKLLLVIIVCGFVAWKLPEPVHALYDRLHRNRRWAFLGVALAWAGVLALTLPEGAPLRDRAQPLAMQASPQYEMERWVRTQTPTDALFAVPPSADGFRTATKRTIVVNFKSIPFEDPALYTWYERLLDLAPMDPPARGGNAAVAALDAAYETQTSTSLHDLNDRYRFTYVVRRTPLAPAGPFFEEVFANEAWYVYRIRPTREIFENPPED